MSSLILKSRNRNRNKNSKIKIGNISFLTIIIFIIYLYFLIPAEASNSGMSFALLIRLFSCSVLICILFLYNGFFKSQRLVFCFLFFIFYYLLTAIIGFQIFILFTVFEGLLLGVFWTYAFSRNTLICKNLLSALKLLIYFSFFSLLLQLIMYRFVGYIDYHQIIYPWSESRFEELGPSIRAGGIYIEPGTLSNWVFSFFLLHVLLRGFIDIKLALITALSMALSLSAWGVSMSLVVFVCAILQAKVIDVKSNRLFLRWKVFINVLLIIIVTIFFSFIFFSDDIISFLELKLSFETGSGDVRLDVYDEFIQRISEIIFLGLGYASDFCTGCLSKQDAGLFFNFAIVYGLIFTVLFFLVIMLALYKVIGVKGLFLFLPLLTTKIYYWDFVIILIFFSAFYQIFLKNILNHEKK